MPHHIDPDRETFGAFRRMEDASPVHMLNLVRFRDQAAYPDGRSCTGEEAYAAYGRESAPIFKAAGGRIAWSGDFKLMLIGPADEHWDRCFIAEYPSSDAFVQMVKNPDYQKAVIHRQAAVADSRLIRLSPLPAGNTFAG
ncbi:DUF1330 domain-containing protein [Oricola sp.]|uniref:DUF1330 domain-containing protein n=1 Tax=Oricola sp. TaxID=1979950 RepID=UPI003BA8F2A9